MLQTLWTGGRRNIVRVRLKGLNSRRKKLADGTWKTYWYAWKGGPPLPGEPGTPEFMAAFNAAASAKVAMPSGVLKFVIMRYEDSAEFGQLAARTKSDYLKHLDAIEREFGTFPIEGLKSKRARVIFSEWKDKLAKRSLRQADYAWTVFARCLSWALKRGLIEANPLERGGRLYRASRAENVWTDDEEARFLAVASPQLRLAFLLAVWTGQRQGDLLSLAWSAYDGAKIRLLQSKGKVRVVIPVAAPIKALLDAEKRRSTIMLTQRNGKPWTEEGFRSSWRKAVIRAGITGRTFHDIRGTAVTRLALAGATEAEIVTLTGHSLRDVRSILDANYLQRDPKLAESAIAKLERRTKIPD
jgi:integrase